MKVEAHTNADHRHDKRWSKASLQTKSLRLPSLLFITFLTDLKYLGPHFVKRAWYPMDHEVLDLTKFL